MKKYIIDEFKKIIKFIFKILFLIFGILKIKKNTIVFISFNGKGYGENPKYICDELLEDDVEIIWIVNQYYDNIPIKVKQVKKYSIKYFYYLSTARVWVSDSRMEEFVKKRKGQFYIQTWHSSLRLKRIEKDAEEHLPIKYIKAAKHDSKMIDIFTCGSNYSYNTYKNSFWYDGNILMTGTPKFDIYFKKNEDIINSIYSKYNVPKSKKIILYAPTFRSFNKKFDGEIDFNLINNEIYKKYVFFVRLHPECKNRMVNSNKIINVSDYPNFQDLLIASNLLITDYSGCCFDCLPNNKKCILYVPDLEEFLKKERNLYFNYNELPFDVVYNIDDLCNTILLENNYYDRYKKFEKSIGFQESGSASKKIANIIRNVVKNEKI